MISDIFSKLEFRYNLGLRGTYAYDVLRKKILQTAPIDFAPNNVCEIHVLTSSVDALNLVWALKSFYHYSQRQYGLCIHDDGTLSKHTVDLLNTHFPFARIISAERSNKEVLPWLNNYPRCQMIRALLPISKKEFDFIYYMETDRALMIDSDVLFFNEPIELLNRIESNDYKKNCFNADIKTSYSMEPQKLQELSNVPIEERYNSGLGLVHKESIRRDWLEEFLSIPGIMEHNWRFEQTIHALCSYRFGCELLPESYDVYLGDIKQDPIVRHYVGAIRRSMYTEGMSILSSQGFLNNNV